MRDNFYFAIQKLLLGKFPSTYLNAVLGWGKKSLMISLIKLYRIIYIYFSSDPQACEADQKELINI